MTEVAIRHESIDYQDQAVRRLTEWAQSAEAAYQVAGRLVESSFVPAAFRGKPIEAAAAILAGLEVGLAPMSSLRAFDVISGQAAPRAITLRAIVQSFGHEVELVESTATQCKMRGRRRGSTNWQTVKWTTDRAKELGLTSKDNWKKQPAAMLIARATSEICRLIAADAILGIGYSAEEVLDGVEGEPATSTMNGSEPEPTSRRMSYTPPADPDAPAPVTKPQIGKIHALAKDLGLDTDGDRADYLAELSDMVGRDIASSTDLTKAEATKVLDTWTAKVASAPGSSRDELIERIKAGAKERGFESWAQVEQAIVDRFAQPFDDVDEAQLAEFVGSLAFGKVKVPEAAD